MHAISNLMKSFFLLFTLLFLSCFVTTSAQIHELGLFVGGSNYIGDIGSSSYIKPNELALGFIYKWNRSPRHAWRFSYMQSNITAQDNKASENARVQRDLKFKNNTQIDFDVIRKKVEDAGFSVAELRLVLNTSESNIKENTHLHIKDDLFHIVEIADVKKLNGTIKLKILDKGFVSEKEYKKWAKKMLKIHSD